MITVSCFSHSNINICRWTSVETKRTTPTAKHTRGNWKQWWMRRRCWQRLVARKQELKTSLASKCFPLLCLRMPSFQPCIAGLCDLNLRFDMFQNDKDKMSAVLARTWNYLSGLGQEPGWAVWPIYCKSQTGVNKKPLIGKGFKMGGMETLAKPGEVGQRGLKLPPLPRGLSISN